MPGIEAMRLRHLPPIERFLYQVGWVNKWYDNGIVRTRCLEWTGSGNGRYGRFRADGTTVVVHRWFFERHFGPVPDGLVLDHLCGNTLCVNPGHLDPVPQRENAWRGAKGRLRTHCVNGHRITEETTYWTPKGTRQCRICMRTRGRNAWERAKADRVPKAPRRCCPNGHEYIPENTLYPKEGGRRCRICKLARSNESYARTGRATRQRKDSRKQGLLGT